MTDNPLDTVDRQLRSFERLFRNFYILGDGVTVQGNIKHGYAVEVGPGKETSGGGGGGGGAITPRVFSKLVAHFTALGFTFKATWVRVADNNSSPGVGQFSFQTATGILQANPQLGETFASDSNQGNVTITPTPSVSIFYSLGIQFEVPYNGKFWFGWNGSSANNFVAEVVATIANGLPLTSRNVSDGSFNLSVPALDYPTTFTDVGIDFSN